MERSDTHAGQARGRCPLGPVGRRAIAIQPSHIASMILLAVGLTVLAHTATTLLRIADDQEFFTCVPTLFIRLDIEPTRSNPLGRQPSKA